MSLQKSLSSAPSPEQFRQSFCEEAGEIVVELEAALLALNETPADSELVGRVFRALHTIKGSGAMFGFDELASFTHELENAFDDVRTGALTVTSELVDVTLAALDQIRTMLVSSRDADACAAILERAHTLKGFGRKIAICRRIECHRASAVDSARRGAVGNSFLPRAGHVAQWIRPIAAVEGTRRLG